MDEPPRIATTPLVVVQRDPDGYSLQIWQPPAFGWSTIGVERRFATFADAVKAQTWAVARKGGGLCSLLDLPGAQILSFTGEQNG